MSYDILWVAGAKIRKYRKWSIKFLVTRAFVFYFTHSSEITNFDSGVLSYLHRGNPIYSGPYLPRQNVLECTVAYKVTIQRPKVLTLLSRVFFYMLSRFCIFPVRKQQVLLHLLSFLPEVVKHLLTNATLSEATSCSLLNDLLTTMPGVRYMKNEPAIVSWKIPGGQRWHPNLRFHC